MLRICSAITLCFIINICAAVDRVPIDQRAIDSGLFIQIEQAVQKGRVQFTVTEPSGLTQTKATVRGAIPFKRGELVDSKAIQLSDDRGRSVPVQSKITAVWPEQSIKFLCLDFMADLKANQKRTYTLTYGKQIKNKSKTTLKINKSSGAIYVDTGALAAQFKVGDALINKLKQNGKSIIESPITGRLLVSKGSPQAEPISKALHIDAVSIAEQGPVQATIYLKGRYGEELSATPLKHQQVRKIPRYPLHIYISMFADSARMEIAYTMGYNGDEHEDFIRAYGFEIDSVLNTSSFVFGDDNAQAVTVTADKSLQLIQPGHSSWALRGTDKTGKRIAGWAGLQHKKDAALIAVRSAWQQWPIRFHADANGKLGVDLYGGDEQTFLDLRYHAKGVDPGTFGENDTRFYKSKSMFTGTWFSKGYGHARARAMGITKTHDIILDFTQSNNFVEVGKAHKNNVILYAGGKRFTETRALGLTGYYHDKDPRMKKMQQYFETMMNYPYVAHEVNGYYGWVDYPDAPDLNPPKNGRFDEKIFAGGRGWTNAERMIPGYMMYYIASGSQKVFDLGHELVYHSIGIDIEHAGGDGKTGSPHRHNQVHWGEEGGPRQAGWRGWYYYYWLTGHPEIWRSIEELHPTAMAISDRHGIAHWPYHPHFSADRWYPQKTWEKAHLFSNSDGTPFHMMNLLRFQTTGDVEFVRFMELVMHVWSENIYHTKNGREVNPDLHVNLTKAPDSGIIMDYAIATPTDAAFKSAPQQGDQPVYPRMDGYYHGAYGGCDLMVEWAQLTGSTRAINGILLFGDFFAEDPKQRIDLHYSKEAKQVGQIYRAYDALAPAYALLRQKTHPQRVQRWRDAMIYRAFDYRYGSPHRLNVDKILKNPLDYTAQTWHDTGINVYGQNGFKIWSGTGLSSMYTLWFVREP